MNVCKKIKELKKYIEIEKVKEAKKKEAKKSSS